jgi:hypothetical protein
MTPVQRVHPQQNVIQIIPMTHDVWLCMTDLVLFLTSSYGHLSSKIKDSKKNFKIRNSNFGTRKYSILIPPIICQTTPIVNDVPYIEYVRSFLRISLSYIAWRKNTSLQYSKCIKRSCITQIRLVHKLTK